MMRTANAANAETSGNKTIPSERNDNARRVQKTRNKKRTKTQQKKKQKRKRQNKKHDGDTNKKDGKRE